MRTKQGSGTENQTVESAFGCEKEKDKSLNFSKFKIKLHHGFCPDILNYIAF